MLNVKSNGVEKQVQLRDDVEFVKPTLNITGTKIKSVSNGLFSYNKYLANFCGYIIMKKGDVSNNEKILDLPVTAEWSNCYLSARKTGDTFTMYVRDKGLYVQNQTTFEEDEYVFLVGSFPIITGGGTQ